MKKLPKKDPSSSSNRSNTSEAQDEEHAEAGAQGLPHIHEDLVLQILRFIPAKQVAKFKCLSKSISSQLSAPDFFHHRRDNQIVGVADDTLMSRIDLVHESRDDFPLRYNPEFIWRPHLVSSFHGVICAFHAVTDPRTVDNDEEEAFFERVDFVSLWNPATEDVKVLPPPLQDAKLANPDNNYYSDFGFGFHAETKDYRVVRVIQNGDKNTPFKSIVEVYSLATDLWRVIDIELPRRFDTKSDSKRPLEGGGLYFWLGKGSVKEYPPLIAFDFNTEVFEVVSMIDVFGSRSPKLYENGELAVLKEKLVYIHRLFRGKKESHFNIWLLDKHGESVSWTKQYTISLERNLRPICFSIDGMILMEKKEPNGFRKLFLSDPDSPRKLLATPFEDTFEMAAVYQESLVSIQGAHGVTYRRDKKWRPNFSWELLLSQTIEAVNDNLANRFLQNEEDLMMFDGLEIEL